MKYSIADIAYINFSNLVYLNWDKIELGSDISDVLWDHWLKNTTDMSGRARHCFMAYSENEDYETPLWDKHFKNWKYLYSSNDTNIANDLFGISINTKSNGFYAVAWQNGNNIMIAFRGTNDLADYITDIELALFDKYSSQLTSVYWFIRHVKLMLGPGDWKFHFTGHSLGGALAQFAHIINDEDNLTCTWNALGLGLYLKTHFDKEGKLLKSIITDICMNIGVDYDITDVNAIFDIWKKFEKVDDYKGLYNEILQLLLSKSGRRNGMYKFKSIDGKYLRLEFGFKQQGKEASSAGLHPSNFLILKRAAMELAGMFKTLVAYNKGINRHADYRDFNIINYSFPNDWTTKLQTRIGKVYDVTKNEKYNAEFINEEKDDSAARVIIATIKNYGFERHNPSNFLLYLDDKGYIKGSFIRKVFIENIIKDMFGKVSSKSLIKKNIKKISDNVYEVIESNTILDDIINETVKIIENQNYYIHKHLYIDAFKYFKFEKMSNENTIVLGRYNNIILDKIDGKSDKIVIKLV